jgi:succinate-acetate transporter protein
MHKYLIGGSVIGSMQVVDAGILYATNGAAFDLSIAFAGLEFLWAVTSLVVAVRTKHKPTRVLALVFILYNVFGWLLGMFTSTPSMPIIVPVWFVITGGIFGLIYAASSIYVAKQP